MNESNGSRHLPSSNTPYPTFLAQPQNDDASIIPRESATVVAVATLLCFLISAVALFAIAYRVYLRLNSSSSSNNNKALDKKILNSFPKLVYRSGSCSEDCAICLTDFAAGDEIRVMPRCGHRFRVECVDLWLATHSFCPYCMQILTEK